MTGEDKNRRSSIRKSKKELYMEMAQKEIREMLKRNKNTGSSTTTSSKSKRELDLEMARKGKEIHKMLKRKASLSFSSVSQDPKKQKPIEDPKWMSMNIKLPSDFLIKDQLNSEDIFPHVNSFCLPTFRDRYKDMSIDDIDAHSVGLAFRSFQASLLLHSKMEEVKKLSTISVKKMEDAEAAKQLAEAKLEAKEREIRELKARLMDLTSQIQEAENSASIFKDGERRAKATLAEKEEEVQKLKTLTETTTSCQRVIDHEKELEQVETYVRLKTRARIMCQYLMGKNPLKDAIKELETFMNEVGTEDDLKSDDDDDDYVGDLRLFFELVEVDTD